MENKQILPIHQRVEAIEKGQATILAKLEEVLARVGNPTMPETLQDPEVLALQAQIQDAIKIKQVSELKKTLADLTDTPIVDVTPTE